MKSKTGTIILIVVLSALALTITSAFIAMLHFDYFPLFKIFNIGKSNIIKIDSIEKELYEVSSINLDLLSTDVEIKEGDKVVLEYYSNQEKNSKVEYEKNTISVNEKDLNNICIGICNVQRKIVLYLPKEYNGKLDINTKSGDVDSLITLDNISINTYSGDIELTDVNNLDLSTLSGDVEIKNVTKGNVKTTSGDIDIQEITKKIDIKTTSGDTKIYRLNVTENSTIKSTSGDVNIFNNNSDAYIETHSTSGDIKVNKSNRKSDIVLKINTTSGDIKVS